MKPWVAARDAWDKTYREKYPLWAQAERTRKIEIGVVEEGGFTRTISDIDQLDRLHADETKRIKRIDISIGGQGYVPPSAALSVDDDSGLTVRLAGHNRAWTAGVRHEVEAILTPRSRLGPPVLRNHVEYSLPLSLLVFLVVGFSLLALLKTQTQWSRGALVAVSFGAALAVMGGVIYVFWKLPILELLAPGERPTYQRWKKAIWAAFVALVIGVIGSIIAAAFD